MILKPYYLSCLSHASYLVADVAAGRAAVVDPQRDVDQYLTDAAALGARITDVFLTHFHADFLAGHLELRERTGAEVHLGATASPEFPFHPLHEGDAVELGRVRIVALETPGHTPESTCLLVYDLERDGQEPAAVFTGDTLFIGDVGRPDLMASVGVTAQELASRLYASLHGKLLQLPDATLVYPAHGAGSMCGKNLGTARVSTIGEERRLNYALQPMEREAFIRLVTAAQPPVPAYFAYDADLNRRAHATLDQVVGDALRPLALEHLILGMERGSLQVLDVRGPDAFAAGHLRGSLNVGLGGRYASWAGSLLDPSLPIVVIADPGREREAIVRLGRIGFDGVSGYLDGGFAACARRPDLVASFERVAARELARELAGAARPWVLDVREPGEREQSCIEASQHIPLGELPARAGEVPRDRRVVIQCAGGYRSSIAASILLRAGHSRIADLIGGLTAWQAGGFPCDPPVAAS